MTVPISPGFTPSPRSPSIANISPDASRVLVRAIEPEVSFVSNRFFLREINLQNPAQDRDLGSIVVGAEGACLATTRRMAIACCCTRPKGFRRLSIWRLHLTRRGFTRLADPEH